MMRLGNLTVLEDAGRVLVERKDLQDYTGISLTRAELRWVVLAAGPAVLADKVAAQAEPVVPPLPEPEAGS